MTCFEDLASTFNLSQKLEEMKSAKKAAEKAAFTSNEVLYHSFPNPETLNPKPETQISKP